MVEMSANKEAIMKYPRKWEDINNDLYAGSARLKIFGGWLVVAWVNTNRGLLPENLLFISDPKHKWELK